VTPRHAPSFRHRAARPTDDRQPTPAIDAARRRRSPPTTNGRRRSPHEADYLLTESALRVLPALERSNPRNAQWTAMKLYLRKQASAASE
jgi:hypothetical protein